MNHEAIEFLIFVVALVGMTRNLFFDVTGDAKKSSLSALVIGVLVVTLAMSAK